MSKFFSQHRFIKNLSKKLEKEGGTKTVADSLGVSVQYINNVKGGGVPASKKLLDFMEIDEVKTITRKYRYRV